MRKDPRFRAFPARAFTLVETVIALGIVGFALTAMAGLLPLGLKNFRKAMDLTVQAEMVQELVAQAKQLAFEDLPALESETYAFDASGNPVSPESAECIYVANILVDDATPLPSTTNYSTPNLARLTIGTSRKAAGESATPESTLATYIAALSVQPKP